MQNPPRPACSAPGTDSAPLRRLISARVTPAQQPGAAEPIALRHTRRRARRFGTPDARRRAARSRNRFKSERAGCPHPKTHGVAALQLRPSRGPRRAAPRTPRRRSSTTVWKWNDRNGGGARRRYRAPRDGRRRDRDKRDGDGRRRRQARQAAPAPLEGPREERVLRGRVARRRRGAEPAGPTRRKNDGLESSREGTVDHGELDGHGCKEGALSIIGGDAAGATFDEAGS